MLKTNAHTINEIVKNDVISELITKLNRDYVFPEVAEKIEQRLLNKLEAGAYDSFLVVDEFAKELTEDLQAISKDKHLRVLVESGDKNVTAENNVGEFERRAKVQNYGFYKIERLQGNIGYIDLRNFHHPTQAGETAVHAMNLIKDTEALIFDLRKNGGGSPEMVALISSYLFEEKVHLNSFYFRPTDTMSESWTNPNQVQGTQYINKPVYILTSNYTFSAAEEFTYNLKNLNRATIVGEITRGGAHPGGFQPITNNFEAFIPTGKAINPITNTNWEGTGVEPHILMDKEEAFAYVYKTALEHVKAKYKDIPGYSFLLKEIEQVL
ncbi:S41 family peptidase [Bacillus luteolus]|uniref:S41 family peptidase n=1 Tax=Litchfieldia luteola TaxID=682179 RepID=A0ABR9QGQ6_9BACI|nr:S41 family peptidase [Cytobacillus luteolus]MBE4907676.1 S41 family peptidase [Cytobacillus luteolus]MBP1941127.1 C-terminal processing protease CtpA/Prc [Cytobacillus luteolus]